MYVRRWLVPGVGVGAVLATLVAQVATPAEKTALILCSRRRCCVCDEVFHPFVPISPDRNHFEDWYMGHATAICVVNLLDVD